MAITTKQSLAIAGIALSGILLTAFSDSAEEQTVCGSKIILPPSTMTQQQFDTYNDHIGKMTDQLNNTSPITAADLAKGLVDIHKGATIEIKNKENGQGGLYKDPANKNTWCLNYTVKI